MLFLAGCGGGNSRDALEEGLREASRLLAEGQYSRAISLLEELETAYPDALEIDEELAQAYFEAGDYELAALYFEGLLDHVDASQPDWRLQAAQACAEAGDLDAAIDHFERYLQVRPEDLVNRRLLAELHAETGDLASAYRERQEAARRSGQVPARERLVLGDLARATGKLDAAAEAYDLALIGATNDGEAAAALLGLLETRLRQRDWAGAYEALTQLRNQHPVALANSDLVAARPTLESSLDSWHARQVAEAEADALAQATEPEPATEEVENVLSQAEEPPPIESIEPDPEPEPEVEPTSEPDEVTNVAANETNPGTILINGQPYTADLEREQAAAERQAELAREASPAARARRIAAQARTAFEAGDYPRSASLYRRALALDGEQASYAYGASRADFERGAMEDAEIMASEAVRLHQAAANREGFDEQPRYTLHYLRVLQRTRPSHTVLVQLFEARKRFPQDPTLTLSLAEAFDRLDTGGAEARAMYEEFLRIAPFHPRANEVRNRLAQITGERPPPPVE